jgi:hypothetical protein
MPRGICQVRDIRPRKVVNSTSSAFSLFAPAYVLRTKIVEISKLVISINCALPLLIVLARMVCPFAGWDELIPDRVSAGPQSPSSHIP